MSKKLIVEAGTLYKKAQGEPGEGPSFEQQFGILANAQITDKYPSLSDYQVAVQLLDKNDDNSFAVCIVVYKLGENLVYVPAVFQNGKIYIDEIMEVPGLQTFLPLSDAWLNWVKNKNDVGRAESIPPEDANLYGKTPGSARSREPIDPVLKNASFKETTVFDTVLKMGKKAALKFMDYLSNTDFINETFKFYSPQDIKGFAKKACEKYPDDPETELITVMDKRASLLTDEQKKILWKDGYVIKRAQKVDWDDRDSSIKVIEKKNLTNAFVTPEVSCKCQILMGNGDTEDITYVLANPIKGQSPWGLKGAYTSDPFYVDGRDEMRYYGGFKSYIIKDGKAFEVPAVTAIKDTIKELKPEDLGEKFSSADPNYSDLLLVLPTGAVLEVRGGFSKSSSDGSFYSYNMTIKESQDNKLRSSLQYDRVLEVPQGTRVILISNEKASSKGLYVGIADLGRTIERFINKSTTKIKMTSDGQEISFYGPASKPSDRFMEKEACLHLVKNYGICPQDAKTMLKMAGAGEIGKLYTTTFLLHKKAELIGDSQEDDSTAWKPADISMTETTEEPPEVTTEDLQNKALEDSNQIVDTVQKATEAGVKEVFDVSVFKLLMQEADPGAAIMDIVPDFMQTLDKLCQMLFMYRCHMQDLEQRYGAVKMKALEKSLQNTIKDLSQLTIFVKLRSLGTGESPDAGDLQTGTMMS